MRDRSRKRRRSLFLESLEPRTLLDAASLALPITAYQHQALPADYDGDGRSDPALYRKTAGQWIRQRSTLGLDVRRHGLNNQYNPAVADYNGDGIADPGVFNPVNRRWVVPSGADGTFIHRLVAWGNPDDLAVPADYDGDGKAELATWRPSTGRWIIRAGGSNGSPVTQKTIWWGLPGDLPVPADYDGDGKADLAVWRPTTGRWFIRPADETSHPMVANLWWGMPGDIPAPADYDGDGKADLAVWRPSTGSWYVVSTTGKPISFGVPWGLLGDVPVAADYDGDGKADLAVWRPGTDEWWVRGTSEGVQRTLLPGVPAPAPLGSSDWWQRHQEIMDASRREHPSVVFLGDSITEGWGDAAHPAEGRAIWMDQFAGLQAANYGLRADTSESLLWRVQQGVLDSQPRAVVLMVGINDLNLNRSPRAVAATIEEILSEIRDRSPETRVLLMGVLPANPLSFSTIRTRISLLNRLIAPLADGRDVLFLDAGPRLLEPNGTLSRTIAPDGLHPSSAGYQILAPLINQPLRILLEPTQTPAPLIPVPADYDGDGQADRAVWDPNDGRWWAWSTATEGPLLAGVAWGLPGDIPVPADYDGDGKADLAVWRPSTARWYIQTSGGAGTPFPMREIGFGSPGDIPVPADYDGDGQADLAVWRPSNGRWHVRSLDDPLPLLSDIWWGLPGDTPVPADYDGDGATDLAVWRPSNGRFFITPTSGAPAYNLAWGVATDLPVPADYDGDGKADLAVWRPSEGRWYALLTTTSTPLAVDLGVSGDRLVPAPYLDRGAAQFAVFRRTSREWLTKDSTNAQDLLAWIMPEY